MEKDNIRIAVIDDEKPIRDILKASLEDENYEVRCAQDGASGLALLREFRPQICLLDIWMPGPKDGIAVLKEARPQFPETEFIIMSGHGTIETAVRATKLGAWDFVEKPLSMDKISILLSNILSYQGERGEKQALLTKLRRSIAMIGDSETLKTIKQIIARVAPSMSWVLITGENGTGKELVARNIHYLSPRAPRPFIEVNCAAIPEELIESELFGHEKGAFTGADRAKKGKFDLAHTGTLFLDEIADMSLKTQAKVLRVLQEQRFERVGGVKPIDVDVRVIAATNKNLETEIKEGRFREDLFYRLNVIPFHIPPLRERQDDIPALIQHFSDQFARDSGFRSKEFSADAIEALKSHAWQGNVRELRNFVERLYILTPGEFIDVHDLRFAGLAEAAADNEQAKSMTSFRDARAHFERDYLLLKLKEFNNNISKTAESIGLERSYLHRKIKSYGIETSS